MANHLSTGLNPWDFFNGESNPNFLPGGRNPGQADLRRPNPPRDIQIDVVGDFTIRVTWKDVGAPGGGTTRYPLPIAWWFVYACPVALAGSPRGDLVWADSVLAKAHRIAQAPTGGQGQFISVTITDETLRDCYIQVVALSIEEVVGIPSTPALAFVASILPPGPLNDVTGQAVNMVRFTDGYGIVYVDLNPQYNGPLDLGRFFSVALYGVGYLGSSALLELGNQLVYEKSQGGQLQKNFLRLPIDLGSHATTLYWVSVDREGKRRADITSAPSTVLAGGIFA